MKKLLVLSSLLLLLSTAPTGARVRHALHHRSPVDASLSAQFANAHVRTGAVAFTYSERLQSYVAGMDMHLEAGRLHAISVNADGPSEFIYFVATPNGDRIASASSP